LWGKKFANEQVKIESARKNNTNNYKTDWKWAISMNKEKRAEKFKALIKI